MFETVIPLLLYILPLVVCIVFWKQVHKFNKDRENSRFIDFVYSEHEKGVFPEKRQ